MPALPEDYERKGKPLTFQFDYDVVELLYLLAPTKKAIGRYLSELVRRDHVRRQDWARAGQEADLVEVGTDA
jgi:hypothetical protein